MSTATFNQGGTVAAPIDDTPLAFQPVDTSKPPFEHHLESSVFTTTMDHRHFFGTNGSRRDPAAPFVRWGMEQDYEVYPGHHVFEVYLEYGSSGANPTYRHRPIYFGIVHATGESTTQVMCGPGANSSVQIGWADGQGAMNIVANFPADGTITVGTQARNLELDAQLFTLSAGSNVAMASVNGYAQLGGTTLYLDGNSHIFRSHDATVTHATLDGSGLAIAGPLGVNGATPSRPTVTGSRSDGTALTNLLAALAAMGLVTDGTVA